MFVNIVKSWAERYDYRCRNIVVPFILWHTESVHDDLNDLWYDTLSQSVIYMLWRSGKYHRVVNITCRNVWFMSKGVDHVKKCVPYRTVGHVIIKCSLLQNASSQNVVHIIVGPYYRLWSMSQRSISQWGSYNRLWSMSQRSISQWGSYNRVWSMSQRSISQWGSYNRLWSMSQRSISQWGSYNRVWSMSQRSISQWVSYNRLWSMSQWSISQWGSYNRVWSMSQRSISQWVSYNRLWSMSQWSISQWVS